MGTINRRLSWHPCYPIMLRTAKLHLRSSVLRTFATSTAITGVGLANSVLLARSLGATRRGELAAVLLWPPFVGSVAGLGMYTAITYFTARKDSQLGVVMGSALTCGALQATIGVLAAYFLLPFLLYDQSASVVSSARLYLTYVPMSFASQYLLSILQGKLYFGALNLLRSIVPVGYFIGTVGLVLLHRLELQNVVIVQIGLQLIVLLMAAAIIAIKGLLTGISVDRHMIRQLMSYGSRVYAGEMTGNVNTRLDQMLLAGLFPPKMLGLYVVAVAAASGPEMLANAVRIVSSPRIAGFDTKADGSAQLVRTFNRYLKASLPFAAALALVLPFLIPMVYGRDFRATVPTAEILVLAGVVLGAAVVLGAGGQALGDPWIASKAQICAVPVTIGLLLFLLPRFGILGAGLASLAAYTAQLIIVVLGLHKHGLSWRGLAGMRKAGGDA